jgi:hypothetical protein
MWCLDSARGTPLEREQVPMMAPARGMRVRSSSGATGGETADTSPVRARKQTTYTYVV